MIWACISYSPPVRPPRGLRKKNSRRTEEHTERDCRPDGCAGRRSGAECSCLMRAAWRVFEPSLLPAPGFGPCHCGQAFAAARGLHGAAARPAIRRHDFFFEPRDSGAAVACFRPFPALPCARNVAFPLGTAGILLPVRGAARFAATVVAPRDPPSAPVS